MRSVKPPSICSSNSLSTNEANPSFIQQQQRQQRKRRREQKRNDDNVEGASISSFDVDELERWRCWSAEGSPVLGFGLQCMVESYGLRLSSLDKRVEPRDAFTNTLRSAVLRIEAPNDKSAMNIHRHVKRCAGLCVVLNWNTDQRCSRRGLALVFVVSWQLRCFCVSMSDELYSDLLSQARACCGPHYIWLHGDMQPTTPVTRSAGNALAFGCETFVVNQPQSRLDDGYPCMLLLGNESAQSIDPTCRLGEHFRTFLNAEISRLHHRDTDEPSAIRTLFRRKKRPLLVGTRRRQRASAVAFNHPAGTDIVVPHVQMMADVAGLRALADTETELSIEDISDAAYRSRHERLEAAEKQERARGACTSSDFWAVCENTACHRWRIVSPQLVKKMKIFFCGGGANVNEDECCKLDDWIVQCIGEQRARLVASRGICTVEGIVDDRQAQQCLTKMGLYYEPESQAIISYE